MAAFSITCNGPPAPAIGCCATVTSCLMLRMTRFACTVGCVSSCMIGQSSCSRNELILYVFIIKSPLPSHETIRALRGSDVTFHPVRAEEADQAGDDQDGY